MPFVRAVARVAPLSFFVLVAACSDGGSDQPDAISPKCLEATMHSDLPWLQENVFTPSCAAFSSCHMGAALDAAGLSLETGQSRVQMVDIDSELFPQFKRVKAGDPDNSYLFIVMGMDRNMDGRADGPLDPDVGTMPYNNPLLCKEKRDAVERWIAAGALEQ